MKQKTIFVVSAIVLLLVFVAGILFYTGQQEKAAEVLNVAQQLHESMVLPNGVTTIITAPGYVNFSLDASVLVANIGRILSEKEAYGKGDALAGQKVMIEYTDPNPFKVFHIGHLMIDQGHLIRRRLRRRLMQAG